MNIKKLGIVVIDGNVDLSDVKLAIGSVLFKEFVRWYNEQFGHDPEDTIPAHTIEMFRSPDF